MLGLGPMEILVLAIIGLVVVVIPIIAVVLVVVLAARRSGRGESSELAALRAENAALRRQIDKLEATAEAPPPTDPTGIRKP
jgi:cell division protein FtsB